MIITRKWKATAAALALVSVLGLAGCGEGSSSASKSGSKVAASQKVENVSVNIGYTPSLCQAPLIMAYEKGYYKDVGLNVALIKIDGASANESIGSGKIDAMQTLITKTIHPWQNGLPVKATTGTHFGCVRAVVRPDSGINEVKDLKGKKIGVAGLADTGAVVLQRALKHAGIGVTPDNMEVEFVVVDRNSLPQALKSGQVDAIAMTDPVGYIAQKQYGFKAVLDTAVTKGWDKEYCCALVVSDKFIDGNAAAAKALTEAVQKGCVYVKEHPEETAQYLLEHKYFTGDMDSFVELLKSYNYAPSVQGGFDAIEASVKDLGEIGIVEKTDPKAFAEANYVKFEGFKDATES